ncbi:MAG TPA: hypothetical protein VFS04_06865 [Alphaproteobacteria bacterium]|nr:hypothetical protein [Alphaproteobacteria bacterium]
MKFAAIVLCAAAFAAAPALAQQSGTMSTPSMPAAPAMSGGMSDSKTMTDKPMSDKAMNDKAMNDGKMATDKAMNDAKPMTDKKM